MAVFDPKPSFDGRAFSERELWNIRLGCLVTPRRTRARLVVFGQNVALSSVISKRSQFCQVVRSRALVRSRDPPIDAENDQEIAMLFEGGFSFANFLMDVLAVFVFVLWLWLLVTIMGDLFRRQDISGLGKTVWVIFMILAPYIGVFAYLIFQGGGMADRSVQQAQQTRDELRREVGFSIADEIEKLDRLKKSGSVTAEEYARLRARLV
jgi:hypothetical protein